MSTENNVTDALQRYMEEVANTHPLSAKEEAVLARRIKMGDVEARTELVKANLRFVVTIAREYQNQWIP